MATEILTSELWTIPETVMNHKETLLRPFWDTVLPPVDPKREHSTHVRTERERALLQFWTDADEERERKSEVIRGMWMRVNASLLQKRTTEMVRFIQAMPNVIERMMAKIESPAVQDMLARIIQTEESVSDVMSWLESQQLIPRLLALLSPDYPPSTHAIAADLLKGIISVSAPNSSFNPQGGNAMDQQAGGGSGHKDNRLVRQLTNRRSITTLVGYMLDAAKLTDRDWKGISTEGAGTHRSDPFVIHPLPSVASATSSLCYVCNVIVEVIRRNNSDLAEPYLFNTMRNRLMAIQSDTMRGVDVAPDEDVPDSDGEASRKKMEEVLPELTDRLAIVHLGNLVAAISERFGELNKLLTEPRSQDRVCSALTPAPLTMERFRVIELYAELLHSSNMATLNRVPGTGPEYSDSGALAGGLDGLDRLGQALQAGEAGEESPDKDLPEIQVADARQLPVSSGSTDYSLESDDVPLSDDEDTPSPTSPQAQPVMAMATTSTPALEVTVPPPPSLEDAERLRDVMCIESGEPTAPSDTTSHVAVAATTAAPSVADDDIETAAKPASSDEALSTGECLKQQLIKFSVLPTLLDLFFEHANNNFLHHLVYDILQQILNGNLGRGYNRELIIDLFSKAELVDRVLAAQKLNDTFVASVPRKPRLSYMGHISLIAEELVKFFTRCPADLKELIKGSYPEESWAAFVNGSLSETRARDSQPLAGGKPLPGLGSGMTSTSERSDSESDDDDDSPAATIGEPLSRTTAKQADSYRDADNDDDAGMEQFWRPSNVRSGAMDSSDDDDDDADWLRPAASRERTGEEDDFGAFQSTASRGDDFDDDDAWGAFTSVSTGDSGENPFGDAFAPSSSSVTVDSFRSAEPLTPRDWAEAFDREFESSEPQPWAEDAEELPAIVVPEGDDSDQADVVGTPTSSWSFPGDESDDLGEDLPPTSADMDAVATRAAALTLESTTATTTTTATATAASSAASGRRRANSISQRGLSPASPALTPDEERDEILAHASSAAHPLGLGVSADTHISHGMLERTMPDGEVVRVPEDDVARGIDEAMVRRVDEDGVTPAQAAAEVESLGAGSEPEVVEASEASDVVETLTATVTTATTVEVGKASDDVAAEIKAATE